MIELTSEGAGGIPLVFLHGWPDAPSLWDDLVSRFAPTRQCIRVQLPAFHGSTATRGADFPELAAQLEAALHHCIGAQPVTFVGHDWGAVLTYAFAVRYPERLHSVVTLDVGGHVTIEPSFAAVFIGYQAWLISAEAVGRVAPRLGDRMARWMARTARAPHPEHASAKAGYPYRYAWRAMLRRRYRKSMVGNFRPRHPHLFLYGARKPFPFHSAVWEQTLADHEGSSCAAIHGGHWFMLDRPDEVYAAISTFVAPSVTRDPDAFPDDEAGDRLWQHVVETGDDLTREREVVFTIDFPTVTAAATFINALDEELPERSPDRVVEQTLFITLEMVPSHPALTDLEGWLEELAASHDAEWMGWGFEPA